ncbi:hypothetical protein [Cohnella sp. GCM10012308]|uniref:hypothetical protein n=1 Tax=Cohnella sp. GCM10012308 TaxID=3317329 RepID=UPI003614A140
MFKLALPRQYYNLNIPTFVEEWREKFAKKEFSARTYKNYVGHVNKHIIPYICAPTRLRRCKLLASTTAEFYAHVTKKASRATADKFNQFDLRLETGN